MAGQFNLKFNGKLGWLNRGRGGRVGNVAQTSLMLLSKATRATATTTTTTSWEKGKGRTETETGRGRKGYCNNSFPTRNAHGDTALPPWSLAGTDLEEYHLVFEWGPRNAVLLQLYS